MQGADLKQKRIMELHIFLNTWHSRFVLHSFLPVTYMYLSPFRHPPASKCYLFFAVVVDDVFDEKIKNLLLVTYM